MSSKRNPKEDVPRRIYRSSIERIDKHLEHYSRVPKTGSKPKIKGDFNKFIELLLDTYEAMQNSPRIYILEAYDSLEEARGEAIRKSVKSKQPVKWPIVAIEVGKDG